MIPSPTISASVQTAPCSVHVHVVLPVMKRPTPRLRSERQALSAATIYRLAGEITAQNVDVGASIALDLHPHDGFLKVETTEDQDITVVRCLVADAMAALRIGLIALPRR